MRHFYLASDATSELGLDNFAERRASYAYHFERDGVNEFLAQVRLIQVLADWSISRPGLFLYYPNREHRPRLLGAFIDCLLDKDLACHAEAGCSRDALGRRLISPR